MQLFFHIIGFVPLDFPVATIPPLDFGFSFHFDNGAGSSNLPALVSWESTASSADNPYQQHPYEIYQRIQILEARDFYNLPPQNNQGDYEGVVRENLSRAWHMGVEFYNRVFRYEYFELRVLELKGPIQERLTHLMLSEPNIGRIMELSPYSDVRKEAHHFIQDRFPPVFVNSFDLPPSHFLINDCLRCLRSLTTNLNGDHNFYKDFYRHFTDEEFRRSIDLPLP
nr:hypothetical protein [Solanum melongena]WMB96866.1 hypothetical protein [Solanum melongena]WMB97047.1 hypothetical protein [Solanum aethiopicum]